MEVHLESSSSFQRRLFAGKLSESHGIRYYYCYFCLDLDSLIDMMFSMVNCSSLRNLVIISGIGCFYLHNCS